MGHCWRSEDKLISDILLWTPAHGRVSVGCQASTYLHQLCVDTGCNLEDLLGAMDDRDGWMERESGKYVLSVDMMMMMKPDTSERFKTFS